MGELYVTPLTEGRRNHAGAVGVIGKALGTPFMRHQAQIAALSTERLPSGAWAYQTIITSLPRQAGKTAVRAPLAIHRCLTKPAARCWLTAQTGQDARDLLLGEIARAFMASPLAPTAKLRKSNGSEGLYFERGSYWRTFSPQSDARGSNTIHGKANELVDVDEAFSIDDVTGAAIEQAVIPSFTTTGGQFAIVSTAGYASSTWFRGYVDTGREAVTAGERAGVALIEYGLTPEQAAQARDGLEHEPGSPPWLAALDLIAREHPAYGTTMVPAVVEQYARLPGSTVDEVLRAFGNVWVNLAASAFPMGAWERCGAEHAPMPDRYGVAFDVTPDGTRGAIAAAWRDQHGHPCVELVSPPKPGTEWMPDAIRALARKHPHRPIGYETGGPSTLAVADRVARANPGITLHGTTTREYATACATIYQAVVAGQLRHPRQPALDLAVENAAQRPLLDAGYGWTRKGSTGSIAPLVAATVALRIYDQLPAERNLTALHAR